jgi:hypothetical protein
MVTAEAINISRAYFLYQHWQLPLTKVISTHITLLTRVVLELQQ